MPPTTRSHEDAFSSDTSTRDGAKRQRRDLTTISTKSPFIVPSHREAGKKVARPCFPLSSSDPGSLPNDVTTTLLVISDLRDLPGLESSEEDMSDTEYTPLRTLREFPRHGVTETVPKPQMISTLDMVAKSGSVVVEDCEGSVVEKLGEHAEIGVSTDDASGDMDVQKFLPVQSAAASLPSVSASSMRQSRPDASEPVALTYGSSAVVDPDMPKELTGIFLMGSLLELAEPKWLQHAGFSDFEDLIRQVVHHGARMLVRLINSCAPRNLLTERVLNKYVAEAKTRIATARGITIAKLDREMEAAKAKSRGRVKNGKGNAARAAVTTLAVVKAEMNRKVLDMDRERDFGDLDPETYFSPAGKEWLVGVHRP